MKKRVGINILRKRINSPRSGINILRERINIPRGGINILRERINIPRRGINIPENGTRINLGALLITYQSFALLLLKT